MKKNIGFLKGIARERGGRCLSEDYVGVKHKYNWECKEGHHWLATADSIINRKSWCPTCAGQRKITVEELQSICMSRGGVLLSKEYINAHSKYEVRCEKGHTFYPQGQSLLRGYWCKKCGSEKLWIDKRKKISRSDYIRAGILVGCQLISDAIPNRTTIKAKWKCIAKGHVFLMTYNNLSNHKQNCPKCQGKGKVTYEDCVNLASSRGGKIVSEIYEPYESQLWKCKNGHIFSSKYSTIKYQKTWCPYCSQSVGERAVRYVLESIFHHEFIKTRPHWLVNKEGKRLELDGYCSELNIAFEHNGKQHYSIEYHRGTSKLVENDLLKIELCRKNKVNLIVVPEVPSMLKFEDLTQYLVDELKSIGLKLPSDAMLPELNDSFRWTDTVEDERMKRVANARSYIHSKKARLLNADRVKIGNQYVLVFDIITVGGGHRRLTEHRLYKDDLWSSKRIDPLTKEEFYPINGKQKYANTGNRQKHNNLKKSKNVATEKH